MNKAKLLLVDDHSLFRNSLKSLLESSRHFEFILDASNGREALLLCDRVNDIDLILLDYRMLDMNGLDVADRIKIKNPKIKILILSVYNDPVFISNVLKSGVNGYLSKNSDLDELMKAIHCVLNGGVFFNKFNLPCNDNQKYVPIELNKSEHDLLLLTAEGKTSSQIAKEMGFSSRTVEAYRRNLQIKLNTKNIAELVHFAHKVGLL